LRPQHHRFFKTIFSIFLSIILSSCQTTRTPRAASEYLFSTDKSQTSLLEDLKAKLTEHKYEIKTFDIETGFLVTKPRRFSIGSGGDKYSARQVVQIRQEGGSVKIRSIYECEYEQKGQRQFEACIVEDQEASAKIQRVESGLLRLLKDNLNKHGS
jgi:hypothetical protein